MFGVANVSHPNGTNGTGNDRNIPQLSRNQTWQWQRPVMFENHGKSSINGYKGQLNVHCQAWLPECKFVSKHGFELANKGRNRMLWSWSSKGGDIHMKRTASKWLVHGYYIKNKATNHPERIGLCWRLAWENWLEVSTSRQILCRVSKCVLKIPGLLILWSCPFMSHIP